MGLTADEILAVLQHICKPMEIPEDAYQQAVDRMAEKIAEDVYNEPTFVRKCRFRQVGWQEIKNEGGTFSYRWVDKYV